MVRGKDSIYGEYIKTPRFCNCNTVSCPFFCRHRILLPFLPICRLYLKKKRGRSTLRRELQTLRDS